MSLACPDPSFLDAEGTSSGIERKQVLAHVAACARCRERLVESDPARLFALLALDEVPAAALDAVSDAVAARLAVPAPPSRRWAVGAGWAAAASLALLIVRVLAQPMPPGASGGRETSVAMRPRAEVEVLSPAGARQVVDMTVGESQVVMIFDERVRL